MAEQFAGASSRRPPNWDTGPTGLPAACSSGSPPRTVKAMNTWWRPRLVIRASSAQPQAADRPSRRRPVAGGRPGVPRKGDRQGRCNMAGEEVRMTCRIVPGLIANPPQQTTGRIVAWTRAI
jgi:hypothetical protein